MIAKRYFKTKDEVEATFTVPPIAESAELLCDVNGWEPMPMRRTNRGKGPFQIKLRLPKDSAFQFRYRLDGRWLNDDHADEYWSNGYGSDNGVIRTSGPSASPRP